MGDKVKVLTVQLGAALSGVGSTMMGRLNDIKRGAVILAATFNRPGTLERCLIEPARAINPANSVAVANENLVGVELTEIKYKYSFKKASRLSLNSREFRRFCIQSQHPS